MIGIGLALGLGMPAYAIRPTEGGLFSFDDEDVIAVYDPDPRIRVTYSTAGPNATRDEDVDASGVPDFVEDAGEVALEALDLYAGMGLVLPLAESTFGLGDLGGNAALDVYLVDFALQADGQFGVDRCQTDVVETCSGYLVVENDFVGYAYRTARDGLEVVVPHELFHGVQMAYTSELDVWASEGGAVWAERQFEEDSQDFLGFADEFLIDPGRSLDSPPAGPLPFFAYGAGLWFDHLTLTTDVGLMVELLEAWGAMADPEQITPVMIDTIEARGTPFADVWMRFARWNLATGVRAGATSEGYPYAADLEEPPVVTTLDALVDSDNRFYPMAASYFRVHHKGGELWFGLEAASPGLSFSLHPTTGGKDVPVTDAILTFDGADPTPRALGTYDPGYFYLVGSQPENGDQSIKVRVCLGAEDDVLDCFGLGGDEDTGVATPDEDGGGCGCTTGAPGSGAFAFGVGMVALSARRRRSAR